MEPRLPTKPNVVITGTPGVGKTSLARAVAECTGLQHLNVGDVIRENGFYVEKDEEFDSYVPDEDALLDHMEELMVEGGYVVDYHSSDLFPERWLHNGLVLILRCSTETLYDRLVGRGYSEKKRTENLDCEIIGICAEEAREAYPNCVVWEMQSNDLEDQVCGFRIFLLGFSLAPTIFLCPSRLLFLFVVSVFVHGVAKAERVFCILVSWLHQRFRT